MDKSPGRLSPLLLLLMMIGFDSALELMRNSCAKCPTLGSTPWGPWPAPTGPLGTIPTPGTGEEGRESRTELGDVYPASKGIPSGEIFAPAGVARWACCG